MVLPYLLLGPALGVPRKGFDGSGSHREGSGLQGLGLWVEHSEEH